MSHQPFIDWPLVVAAAFILFAIFVLSTFSHHATETDACRNRVLDSCLDEGAKDSECLARMCLACGLHCPGEK